MKNFKTKLAAWGLALLAIAPLALAPSVSAQQPISAEELEFFETKIRPMLIESCYKCHSTSMDGKPKGGLYLDSKEALLKGGSTGPAIVPGNAERSLFIKAIRYTDPNLQMPPKEKLSPDKIADLEAWVKMGAPDPRTGKQGGVLKTDKDKDKTKKHWAFQPIKMPAVPTPKSHLKTWIQNPIDTFVLAKMEEKGMLPSPPADRWTLIRRAYYDLIGIPPTPEAVEKFLNDESPEAWGKVIDDLLASPQYGERWGRYWLDIARYADTRGGANNNRMGENRMVYSFTYRDYVVNSFNDDLPYDQFLIQQIAADKIKDVDKKALAGMGFLTMSRQANAQETIDDRIDVISRGMMSLGVYCARCHDHKFDPIPTKDYYSLYGVFLSSAEPTEKPVIETPDQKQDYQDYLKAIEDVHAKREGYKEAQLADHLGKARANTANYMLLAHGMLNDDDKLVGRNATEQQKFVATYKLDVFVMQRWVNFAKNVSAKETDPIWGPWAMYHKLEDKEFAAKTKEISAKFAANDESGKKFNTLVARAFSTPALNMKIVAERYAKLFGDAEKAWSSVYNLYDKRKATNKELEEPKGLPEPAMEQLRKTYLTGNSPVNYTYAQIAALNNGRIAQGERTFADTEERININHPGSPKRAMILQDKATPVEANVMIKGMNNNLGPKVPRQFLEILSGPDRKPFSNGSGRLELAQAIASKDNPLTARVLVNRVWMNHFGAPIVRTPTDFGMRAEDPTHPEMLDWLASTFIEGGWSVKKLHKIIMMSNIYQQSSDDRPKCNVVDPSNLYVWKVNRRRLDFEAFRDSLLAVSGKLDLTMGGQAVNIMNINEPKEYTRRTLYGFIDRRNLATVFRTFDFANPDITTGQRFNSTVPQQALFMMNSTFVAELARNMISRTDFKDETDEDVRINKLFQLAYQRAPSPTEMKLAKYFLEVQSGVKSGPADKPVWQYGFGEYSDATKKMLRFNPLGFNSGRAWQGGQTLPDARFAMLHLTADGGHPGVIKGLSVIRRWTAPKDGTVTIDGMLGHRASKDSDGVQGVIVSSRSGEMGRFVATGRTVPTAAKADVKRGDTIDFVVDCRANARGDQFTWAPVLKMAGGAMMTMAAKGNMPAGTEEVNEWRAAGDFNAAGRSKPKPFGTWEKFAQVLLLSNELSFVD